MSPTAQRASSVSDIEAALDDITAKGTAAFRDTKASVNKAVSTPPRKDRKRCRARATCATTLLTRSSNSVRRRPYTTLAIAGAIGFLYGAMRRR